jgi:Ca2+:H+ antiporter
MFQLWTHAYIYSPEASAHHSAQTHQATLDGPGAPPGQRVFRMPHLPSLPSLTIYGHSSGSDTSSITTSSSSSSDSSISTVEGEEVPKLKLTAGLLLLVITTVVTGITAEYLVS